MLQLIDTILSHLDHNTHFVNIKDDEKLCEEEEVVNLRASELSSSKKGICDVSNKGSTSVPGLVSFTLFLKIWQLRL